MTDELIPSEVAQAPSGVPVTEEIPVPEEEAVPAEAPVQEAPCPSEVPVEEPESEPSEPERVVVADIQFRSGSKVYYFDPGELTLKAGDHVIMDTARGHEFGYCTGCNHAIPAKDVVPPLRKILRIATEKDEKINEDNRQKEKKAYEICQQKIQAHGLDMQLVSAECAFDGSKLIFFFTADGRVDFRELVKNLASVFRTRIELRQIGVRDKAKMVGGLGICGRPFCCKEFLDDFQPVSIKMAKTQNLSLNPTKISGTCGRLMCCLKYEQEAYEDLLKTSPKNESFVDTVDGRGTVVDVNLLRQTVRVRMEDQPDVINTYANADICVLRSGKAKKNDLPIPKDLAPISSKPRPARKLQELPDEPLPEVIIAGDMPQKRPEKPVRPAPEKAAEPPEKSDANRRRRRKPSGQAPKPDSQPLKQESQPKQPRPERSKQNQPRSEQPNRPKQNKPRPPKQEQPQDKPRQNQPEKQSRPGGQQSGKPEDGQSNRRRRRRPRSGPKPEGGAPKQEG